MKFDFKDGSKYEYEPPKCYIDGLISSTKVQVFYDTAVLKDVTNGLRAEIKFYPEFDNSIKGVVNRTFNWLSFGLLEDKNNNPITGRPNRADDLIL